MWLFQFDHLWITVCVYDSFEDQERHRNRLDEIHTHWKRLRFEYEVDPKLQKADIYLLPKWDILQVFFLKTVLL